jgi:hypothetical protein
MANKASKIYNLRDYPNDKKNSKDVALFKLKE